MLGKWSGQCCRGCDLPLRVVSAPLFLLDAGRSSHYEDNEERIFLLNKMMNGMIDDFRYFIRSVWGWN
jgi:hypothetical protein